jgi:hypothetical protein
MMRSRPLKSAGQENYYCENRQRTPANEDGKSLASTLVVLALKASMMAMSIGKVKDE